MSRRLSIEFNRLFSTTIEPRGETAGLVFWPANRLRVTSEDRQHRHADHNRSFQ